MSKVVVLVGLPGSGKSTFCEEHYPNYVRISQDELGSRDACLAKFRWALENREDVIIDRTNINEQQRNYWVNTALQYGVKELRAVYLHLNEDECVARIHLRKNHPTIKEEMPLAKKRDIVYQFAKSLTIPKLDEGFNVVELRRV